MAIRPVDIARKLGISTSTLRRYEQWGLVPLPERTASGYRVYTEVHVAYFECLSAMLPGFGMKVTKEVLKLVQQGMFDDAFWVVNREQARVFRDKTVVEQTVRILENEELDRTSVRGGKTWMTIKEAASLAGVSGSAIRHWENEGLIRLPRDPENGYRRIHRTHLRQIRIIRILRSAHVSLETIRQVLKELGDNPPEVARRFARDSFEKLNAVNRRQMRGICSLQRLVTLLESGTEREER